MANNQHGLTIGIERFDDDFFVTLKAVGQLTHQDYEVITPLLDSALSAVKQPKVKLLFDATALKGWDLRAAWDDFKLGLKHGNEFTKIAIVGTENQGWLSLSSQLAAWFITGDIQFFTDKSTALAWLQQ